MIVVEGPDGAGKTTLIQNLSLRFNIPVAPRVVTTDGQAETNLADWVDKTNKAGFQRMIFDRHRLISNPIYSPIMNKAFHKSFLNRTWITRATEAFYGNNPYIIYCLPSLKVVRQNVMRSDSNAWLRQSISNIYEAYVARAAIDIALRPSRTTTYDYTADGMEADPLATFNSWFAGKELKNG